MAGDDVKAVDVGGVDSVPHVGMVDDALIQRAIHLLDIDSQSARRVGLRVGIHYQHRFLQCGERCCQIDGRSSLAHATFLVC